MIGGLTLGAALILGVAASGHCLVMCGGISSALGIATAKSADGRPRVSLIVADHAGFRDGHRTDDDRTRIRGSTSRESRCRQRRAARGGHGSGLQRGADAVRTANHCRRAAPASVDAVPVPSLTHCNHDPMSAARHLNAWLEHAREAMLPMTESEEVLRRTEQR